MKKKVLILGAGGMLGHRLVRSWADRFTLAATVRSSVPDPRIGGLLPPTAWHGDVDARRPERIAGLLEEFRPEAIVNCIGVVKRRVETDDVLMVQINSLFPHQLARLAARFGSRLIHLSTDCVFSGLRGHYAETDRPDPPDLYGCSKLAGEPRGPGPLTIRTSMIGWELSTSQGLAEWFLRQRGDTAPGFTRAIYSGLTTAALADLIASVITTHTGLSGMYHLASDPISKHDLLSGLNERMGLGVRIVPDDSLVCDRSLDGSRFLRETGIHVPSQSDMLNALAEGRRFYDDVDF